MLTPETIQALQAQRTIEAAATTVGGVDLTHGLAALPDNMTVHDLERHLQHRRRMRGQLATGCLDSFCAYVLKHEEPGAMVFVSDQMSAKAVLNLGNEEHPGHADHTAALELKMLPAHKALLDLANRGAVLQREFAEFLEDWAPFIKLQSNGAEMDLSKAVAAVRKLTIEQTKKAQHTSQALSESRSTFEQIEASSETPLPTGLVFECQPYHPLKNYAISARIAILTGTGEAPAFKLHLIRYEEKREEMAAELCEMVKQRLATANTLDATTAARDEIPVIKGKHTA
jgi:uncharacterized protein YfdQ (DUF2303 family)